MLFATQSEREGREGKPWNEEAEASLSGARERKWTNCRKASHTERRWQKKQKRAMRKIAEGNAGMRSDKK